MFSTARRIKSPERGLLALHPFVDVLEGRSLMTATAVGGTLAVGTVADARPPDAARSPWAIEAVAAPAAGAAGAGGPATARTAAAAADPTLALAVRPAPAAVTLDPRTTRAAFGDRPIGDTPWTLFAGGMHDRRSGYAAPPLPTAAEIEAARAAAADADAPDAEFRDGRPLTGAMMPFLTMRLDQANHPFAA